MRDNRSEGFDISAFFGFLRRRGLIILLAATVGALAGYAISKGKDEQYTAGATVLLKGGPAQDPQQLDFEPGVPEASQDREKLARSDSVLDRARARLARRFGQARASEHVSKLSATSPEDSALIDISVDAPSPRGAAAAANAVAGAIVADRRVNTIARIRRALRAAERERGRLPGGAAASPAIAQLEARLQSLRTSLAVADGSAEITDRAAVPSAPSAPKPARDAVIGGFAGLLIGFALALVREQLDRRLKHSKELGDVFGLPVLASVPKSRALAGRNGAALEKLPASDAEAFQMLRANLRFLNTDKDLRSVVVTSPGVGDGKSTVALNLAKADAAVGKKVLLIEADVRRPRLAPLLGIEPGVGLAGYLADPSVELVDAARRVVVAPQTDGPGSSLTMDVLAAGNVPQNPSELINSERMRDLVQEAEREYDLVVIDTSPAGIVADAIPLMSQATAVVIVGRVGRITGNEAGNLREQLERIDAPAFGLVANFAGSDEREYGYGYY